MIACRFCQYPEVKVISSNPYGDEVVVQCINCEEIFEVTKEEMDDE